MEYQAFHNVPWEHGSFWVFVAILIFALLAGRRIVSALTTMLDARTNQVAEQLAEAARLKQEAEAMLAEANTSSPPPRPKPPAWPPNSPPKRRP